MVSGCTGRSRWPQRPRHRRRTRLADARQLHCERRQRDGARYSSAHSPVPRGRSRALRCRIARRDRPSWQLLMSILAIEGGHRLSGSVDVEGNKNSALPLLAACLLTTEECVLTNVPRISDVEVMARLLLDLGGHVEGIGSTTLRIRCSEVIKAEPDPALVGRLRGSVLLL